MFWKNTAARLASHLRAPAKQSVYQQFAKQYSIGALVSFCGYNIGSNCSRRIYPPYSAPIQTLQSRA